MVYEHPFLLEKLKCLCRFRTLLIHINRGDLFIDTSVADASTIIPKGQLVPMTVDGYGSSYTGKSTQLLNISKKIITPYTFSKNAQYDRMLTKTVSSLGVNTQYTYENLTNGDAYRITNYKATYPNNTTSLDLNIIREVESYLPENSAGSIAIKRYSYKNAVVNRQGLGFKGLEKRRNTRH